MLNAMTIGIMGAMPEEVDALLPFLERDRPPVSSGMRTYHTGSLWGHQVVIVHSRMGKVAAATSATHLIVEHEIESLLFTGVAGAISPDVSIGDIVVARSLLQHDLDARPIFPRFEAPLLGRDRFGTLHEETAALEIAARTYLADDHDNAVDSEFDISSPRVHTGLVISGDQFISDPQTLARLRVDIPDALCVEMEGAAVAQVCYEHGAPCLVVRTISDDASHGAEIDFAKFVDRVASHYAVGVTRRYLAGRPASESAPRSAR